MFRGIVERPSHENGLLVSFTGSSPALGSRLIDGGGRVVGIVDTVIGHVEEPMVHMKLKLDTDPTQIIGLHLEVQSRQSGWDERKHDGRGRNDERRGQDRRGGDRRGGDRRGGDRRGGDRRGGDRRGGDRRGGNSRNDGDRGGDWTCPKCQNSNFSFRQECNRCQAPRSGGGDRRGGDRRGGRDQRGGGRRNDGDKGGDWTCPKCQNSNFAFRR
ncbi:MAG: zinc finger protein, partial [Candidatus Poseidoniaceae archaeon]|nr:zinc finger protein [Candidatus Poseidoniaceae archaeon]